MRIQLYDEKELSSAGKESDGFVPYLDTFLLPDAMAPLGAVLVCPGGGYAVRAAHEGDPVAEAFNKLGFHAFVLQYRVAPWRYPAALHDALRAIALIRSRAGEWKVDPAHVAILGFSAGGHLAGSAALLRQDVSPRPDAMILCYPVIAATEVFAHTGSMDNLLGENPPAELLRKMDLHKAVDENAPPAFLWHTADDTCVPMRNSLVFAEAMGKYKRPCEMHIFPHGSHGLGLGAQFPDIAQWPALAATFLEYTVGFPRLFSGNPVR